MKPAKQKTLKQILDYLFPKPEQANDVKAWAADRLRRMKAKRRGRAA